MIGFWKSARTSAPQRGSRFLGLESLELRKLFAGISAPDLVPAQYAASIGVFDNTGSSIGIGEVLKSVSQNSLSLVNQSESYNGMLYTVGGDHGVPGYVMTDLLTGQTTKVMLPSLHATKSNGYVSDINQVGTEMQFVGMSTSVDGVNISPTLWSGSNIPSLVQPPAGASTTVGVASSIVEGGLVVGQSGISAFVKTTQGSYFLPSNQPTEFAAALDASESGRFIVGGIAGGNAVWEAVENPQNGNFQQLLSTWQLHSSDDQGVLPFPYAVDNVKYPALFGGEGIDVNGDKYAGIWAPDGSLLKYLGVNSKIVAMQVVANQTFVAYNDPSGAHILNFESGKVYDLKTLLGTTSSLELTPGAIFTTTENGKPTLGVSYLKDGALTASIFELTVASVDLTFDFNGDGIVDLTRTASLPDTESYAFTELGPHTIKVTVDGVPIEKPINVVNVLLEGKKLRIGGDSRGDVVALEKLATGAIKLTVNGISQEFAAGAVDEIFANLDGGSNRIVVDGAIPLNAADLSHVGRVTLLHGAQLDGLNSTTALQMGAKVSGEDAPPAPVLVIDVPPMTTETVAVNPVTFSSEWKFERLIVANDDVSHLLSANGIQILVRNGVYQNPINRLDTNGDGHVSPLDVLLVINYLNSRVDGGNNLPIDNDLSVNGDNEVFAIDALIVIDFLNARPNGGGREGEGASSLLSDTATAAPPVDFSANDEFFYDHGFQKRRRS